MVLSTARRLTKRFLCFYTFLGHSARMYSVRKRAKSDFYMTLPTTKIARGDGRARASKDARNEPNDASTVSLLSSFKAWSCAPCYSRGLRRRAVLQYTRVDHTMVSSRRAVLAVCVRTNGTRVCTLYAGRTPLARARGHRQTTRMWGMIFINTMIV